MDGVVVYGDFACPLSRMASDLADALRARGLRVEWRAVRHEGRHASGSRFVGMACVREGSRRRQRAPATVNGDGLVTLRTAPAFDVSLANAALASTEGDPAHALRGALFRAHWQDRRDLSDTRVVEELAGHAVTRPSIRAQRWQRAWEGFDDPAVPLVLLHTGYVFREADAIDQLTAWSSPTRVTSGRPGNGVTSRPAGAAHLETDMRPILVGYDDSPPARAALQWAAHEASRNGAVVVVAYAISPVWEWMLAAVQVDSDRIRMQRSRDLRGPWTQPLRASGVPYATRLVSGRPGPALLKLARSTHASCIVIGADRHCRLGHWSEGPVQRFVQHHARRPVVSVPADGPPLAAEDELEHSSESSAVDWNSIATPSHRPLPQGRVE